MKVTNMALEDVIAQSLADAREEGVLEPNPELETVEPTVDEDEPTADEGAGDGAEADAEVDAAEEPDEPELDENGEPVVKPAVEPEKKDDKKPVAKDEKADDIGPAKDKRGRENKLPHSRVLELVDKAKKGSAVETIGVVAKTLGLDVAKVTAENFEPTIKAIHTEMTTLRGRIEGMDIIEPIMRKDGDAFIRMLAETNPEQYAKFAEWLDSGGVATVATPAAKDDPKPEPDAEITLPDGSKGKTFSAEGYEKYMAWLRRDITREVEAKYDKRIKPFETARDNATKQAQTQTEILTALDDLLEEANTWHGFTENKDTIQAAMADVDKKIPMGRAMRIAYQKVVVEKMKTDRATMRAEIMKELKKAPKSTQVTGGVGRDKSQKPVVRGEDGQAVTGTEAAIRESLALARASGALK